MKDEGEGEGTTKHTKKGESALSGKASGRGCGGWGMAVEGLPVVVRAGGRGVEGGAREERDDGVAEEAGGIGAELFFERVDDGLLVALLAEQLVECGERLGASAAGAFGSAAGVAADTGCEHGVSPL